ncbi:MAG: uroporphyrinogen decarboxylase [bacterium]|nr:uroporphyrinogen decarboxylase [bacterium]
MATQSSDDKLQQSNFLRACRREPVDHTPIWIMRQAGRYMKAYRDMRAKVSFLDMCKRPDLAAEVTLMPIDVLKVDAAILFADILLIVEPMGVGLTFSEGKGPSLDNPIREASDLARLREVDPDESLAYVFEAARQVRQALPGDIPLIGFSGAPFTVASYMIEGGGSRDYLHTKTLMYRDPGAWHALMEHICRGLIGYLNGQIAAGAQAVQLFDSWVGALSPDDYREFVLPHSQSVIRGLTPGVPVIHFGTGTATLLKLIREAGGDVIGLDWRVNLATAWEELGYDVGVQGNLESIVLMADRDVIRRRAQIVLDRAAGRPGHIFNLGHGIMRQTPVENAVALVEAVHEFSQR